MIEILKCSNILWILYLRYSLINYEFIVQLIIGYSMGPSEVILNFAWTYNLIIINPYFKLFPKLGHLSMLDLITSYSKVI
jgi:hypothetical protein